MREDSGLLLKIHPNAPSNRSGSISAAYKKHEDIKKWAYGQRVRDVEHGVFTPLVFSTTGGMGQKVTTFYKRLADMLAWKEQKPYSVVITWLRCKLSFAAVRSSCASMGQGHPTTDPYVRPILPSQHPRVASHKINSSTIQFFHLFSPSLSQYIYIYIYTYPSGFVVLLKKIFKKAIYKKKTTILGIRMRIIRLTPNTWKV